MDDLKRNKVHERQAPDTAPPVSRRHTMREERTHTNDEIRGAWRRAFGATESNVLDDLLTALDRPRYRDDLPVMYDGGDGFHAPGAGVTFGDSIPSWATNIRVLMPVDVEERIRKEAAHRVGVWLAEQMGNLPHPVDAVKRYAKASHELRDRWVDTGEVCDE